MYAAIERKAHLATNSIKVLLQLGADINTVENAGRLLDEVIRYSGDNYDILLQHYSQMGVLNLPMSVENKRFCEDRLPDWLYLGQSPKRELKLMQLIHVLKGFTLRDLLEEGALAKFHNLADRKKNALLNFIDSIDLDKWFPDFSGLIRLQRSKFLTEPKLCRYAVDVLARHSLPDRQVMDSNEILPHLCMDHIISFLSNEHFYNLTNLAQELINAANKKHRDKE